MFDAEMLKFVVPSIVAVVGWFAAHQFNVHRDRQNKHRDLRIQFLLEAYRRLESVANREEKTEDQMLAFEPAVADIQLLGSPEQIIATISYLRQQPSAVARKSMKFFGCFEVIFVKKLGFLEKLRMQSFFVSPENPNPSLAR